MAVVTTKHKNVGRTRVAIAVAVVLVVPALLNMLTNEVLRARHPVPGRVVVALAVDPKVKKRLRSNELADLKPGGR